MGDVHVTVRVALVVFVGVRYGGKGDKQVRKG